MTATSLTLADLRTLCDRYVPRSSRHPDSLHHHGRSPELWRYSHEIGHLLTAPPIRIGSSGFGMSFLEGHPREDEWIPYDLAAMDVSRRLLAACGRSDLYDGPGGEREDGNFDVVRESHHAVARRILRRRRVLRLPIDRPRLEAKLRRVVEQAPRTQRSERPADRFWRLVSSRVGS